MNDINEITVVLGVVGVTIVLFIWNRLPVEVVAVGASLVLLAAGVVDVHRAQRLPTGNDGVRSAAAQDAETASRTGLGNTASSAELARTMIRQPGAYRFEDYPRFGLPILVLYGVLVVFYIPLLWSL